MPPRSFDARRPPADAPRPRVCPLRKPHGAQGGQPVLMRFLPAAWLLLLLAPVAGAFASVPPGSSVHDEITEGAKEAGFSDGATAALQQAVREPDYQESELDPQGTDVGRIDATAAYRAEHHCDRVPGTSDADAFNATMTYIHEQRDAAASHSASGEPKKAVAALGRALHALQDCYSHSNIVDLPDHQAAYRDALFAKGGPVPGLRLVSYEPGADDPERPEGEDYSHGAYAKDSADKNDESKAELPDGRTKFEAARDLAREATVGFLERFLLERTGEETAALMAVDEEDHGLPDDANVPALPLAVVVVALAAAVLARRR